MNTCKNPNYVIIENRGDDLKKVVHFATPQQIKNLSQEQYDRIVDNMIQVPCGKCVSCRLEYSRVWANRCYLESLTHPFNWFITLTYDDAHLVYGSKGFPTLEKDALSLFIRKLRDRLGHDVKVRFFGCGEYGDTTMRPHYHVIVFGPKIEDLTIDMPDMSKPLINGNYPIFRRKNSNGDYVFFSQTIFDCWQKGKIEIEECSWNTSAYVSRYVMKKQVGQSKAIYDRLGILPEYLRMSNRPGIGADWLIYNKNKLLENDYLSVKNAKGVQTSRPPRYFTKLMQKDPLSEDCLLVDTNKHKRMTNMRYRCKELLTTKSVGSRASDDIDFIEKKSKLLKRDIT